MRNLEDEFGESSNAIRVELNKFEKSGLLDSRVKGNKKLFRANTQHPLYSDIHNLTLKHVGFDKIIERIVLHLGNIQQVFLVGKLAQGINTEIIDLLFVGKNINKTYLVELVEKAESIIKKNIRYLVFSDEEIKAYIEQHTSNEILLVWEKE